MSKPGPEISNIEINMPMRRFAKSHEVQLKKKKKKALTAVLVEHNWFITIFVLIPTSLTF